MHSTLYRVFWSILLLHLSSALDIIRNTNGDVFTSQRNDTWCSGDCHSRGGECTTMAGNCCIQCQCRANQTTYLRHKNQCISSENLTSVLFRDAVQGCSYRLVANDYHDSRPRGSQPCGFTDLELLALDQTVSGSQLIDICGIFTWSISSCEVMSGAYYDRGHWKDLWNAGSSQTIYSVEKRLGVAIHLKWDNSLSRRYHGYILSLDVRCKRKFGRKDVTSCLLFKVQGTQMGTINERHSTARPANYTATPTIVNNQYVTEPSDPAIMVMVVGVICGLFALLLLCLVIWCFWKRKGLQTFLWRKQQPNVKEQEPADVAMTRISPLYDVSVCQGVNCVNKEPPVYTTPDRGEYQDLLTVTKSTYQELITKPRDSPEFPMYHTLEEPGNNNTEDDVTTQEYQDHIYHVLEGTLET